MAQTYTLKEAADKLGVSPEEMKRRLKEDWKTLRAFRDGSEMRFRANEIEELSRSLGGASDPGLPLAPMGEAEPPGSDDFRIAPSSHDEPLQFGSSDDDIFSLSAEEPPPPPAKGKKPDSDVRLEPKKPKSGDSDVRLEGSKKKPTKDAAVIPTEEISLDFSGPGSAVIKGGSSAKLSAPKSSTKLPKPDSSKNLAKPPGTGDSSEFELSLDSDSDDFELQLNTDSSDEVDLGALPKPKGGSGRKGGESGINLRDPADSGISLEKKRTPKPADPNADSDDFELSLDPGPGASGVKLSGPKSGGKLEPVTSDSDSEFELTLDDSGGTSSLEHAALDAEEDKNDIFETDFEIPPMSDESGSEAVALESDTDLERSDFELEVSDSDVESEEDTGSQVVLLEDEGAGGDVDLAEVSVEEEDDSASSALVGVRGRRRHDDEEDEEDEPATVSSGAVAGPAPWGPFPAIILFPAFIIVMLGGLAGYDVLHTMWGYQQPKKPSAPIVRWVAKTLNMDIKDQ